MNSDADPFADLRKPTPSNPSKMKLHACVCAITESLGEKGITSPSSTHFFACILSAIEFSEAAHHQEMITLLARVIVLTSQAVLQKKFTETGDILLKLISNANNLEVRHPLLVIFCVHDLVAPFSSTFFPPLPIAYWFVAPSLETRYLGLYRRMTRTTALDTSNP
jgi:hypothetical protein